jgi:predicted oxidoreductase (fatty acid repression mutant protein)
MTNKLLDTYKARRSIYAIGRGSPLSDAELEKLVSDALLHAPSPFNSQSARVALLLGSAHDGLWEATRGILHGLVKDAEAFAKTSAKIDGFKAGHGTVLFFEDQAVVKGLQDNFPAYAEKFPVWSLESAGMLQYMVWTALEDSGLGASLQHYNPLIDEWARAKVGAPESWVLVAQMPFGSVEAPAGEKAFSPLEPRFKVVR